MKATTNKYSHITLLSLDTSSTATGYAIFINGKYKESGEIKAYGETTKRRDDMILKLHKFMAEVRPDIVIIEMPSKPVNAGTQRILTIIYGACLTFSLLLPADFIEKRPSTSRKYAVIDDPEESVPKNRKEIKTWAIEFTKKKIGKDVTDNEADAYIQGLGYLNWWKEQEKKGRIKKE